MMNFRVYDNAVIHVSAHFLQIFSSIDYILLRSGENHSVVSRTPDAACHDSPWSETKPLRAQLAATIQLTRWSPGHRPNTPSCGRRRLFEKALLLQTLALLVLLTADDFPIGLTVG